MSRCKPPGQAQWRVRQQAVANAATTAGLIPDAPKVCTFRHRACVVFLIKLLKWHRFQDWLRPALQHSDFCNLFLNGVCASVNPKRDGKSSLLIWLECL